MEKGKVWFFVLPALLLHGSVILFPSVSSLFMSFYKWTGMGKAKFVGLENFQRLFFEDEVFWTALLNNIKWTVFFLTVPIILGIIVAFLVTNIKGEKEKKIYRIIFFIPVVVAPVVVGRLWGWIYDPFYGLFKFVFTKLGFTSLAQSWSWLGNPKIALYSVALVDNWHWWGFVMLVFLGACLGIDPIYYEVAKIDGANKWQEMWFITVPMIAPTLAFIMLMTVIWSFLAFEYVWIMTQGGPGHSTELLATWIYKKAFLTWEAGYACSIAVILFLLSSIFIIFFIYLRRKELNV